MARVVFFSNTECFRFPNNNKKEDTWDVRAVIYSRLGTEYFGGK